MPMDLSSFWLSFTVVTASSVPIGSVFHKILFLLKKSFQMLDFEDIEFGEKY
jgi:hypothetical protein